MAGMKVRILLRRGAAAAGAAILLLELAGCTQTLDIRNIVEGRVNPPTAPEPPEWTGAKTIVSSPAFAATVAVNGDTVYVVYFDYSAQKLRIIKSMDRALTWSSPFTIDNTAASYGTMGSLTVDSNNLYIIYNRGGDSDYFIQLTDTGSSFAASNGQKLSTISAYPYGYESSIAYDTTNVYLTYSAGGGPAFAYSAKGASMSFPVSTTNNVLIDLALSYNPGNRKWNSTDVDASGKVNVCYFDDVSAQNGLKVASFTPGSALPMTVNPITLPGPTYIAAANYPSIGYVNGIWQFISYYDTASQNLSCFEHFSYTYPPLMIGYKFKTVIVDNSSANTGLYSKCLYIGSKLNIAYYDATNKRVRFAKGVMNASTHEVDYTTTTVDTVRGTDMNISFAANGDALYVVYPDLTISGSLTGGLKIAKSLDGGATW